MTKFFANRERSTSLSFASKLRGIIVQSVLPGWFWACAAYYLWSCLAAAVNYSWSQPSFDQYRVYLLLLQTPFPWNVLLPDNGHHSIFPSLVILAENDWLSASQSLQSTVGVLCALLTSAIPAVCVLRETHLNRAERAAGILLSVLGVFWLANAVSLLHGNEGLSVYLVSASMAVAAWCTYESKRRSSYRWLIAAAFACAVATFSFGSGIASFPAIVLLGILLRLPWRKLLVPIIGLAFCLVLYLFVLPGDDSIRGMLSISPVDSMRFSAHWLSSPWIVGWLGLADPPGDFASVNKQEWYGAFTAASANVFVRSTFSWRIWSIVLGGCGALGFAVYLLATFFRRREVSRTEAVAVGIAIFVGMTAAIIGIGRLNYLLANPDQSFADRYLIWSSLFWASIGLLVLMRARRNATRIAGALFLLVLPVMLYATHINGLGWNAAVYRNLQATAAGLRSDVFDDTIFPSDATTGHENELRSIELLKEKHLAMFAHSGWERLGTPGPSNLDQDASVSADAHWDDSFIDQRNGLRAARFSGMVTKRALKLSGNWQIIVLDEAGEIAGFGEYSYTGYKDKWFNLLPLKKRGFDGYVRNYDSSKKYTLALWNKKYDHAVYLADLSAEAPSRESASQH